MVKLEFTHDKSDQVGIALKTKGKLAADAPMPVLFWFPVVLLGLTALDYMMLFFNDDYAGKFFRGDTTIPLLSGVAFALMYTGVTAGVIMRRRWSVWAAVGTMAIEFLFCYAVVAGGNLDLFLEMRVPLIDAMGRFYPFGAGPDALWIHSGVAFFIRDGVFLVMMGMVWFYSE